MLAKKEISTDSFVYNCSGLALIKQNTQKVIWQSSNHSKD
jgi:hypothetical protein